MNGETKTPIRLSITAYSTAVGPSSFEKNLKILEMCLGIRNPSSIAQEGKSIARGTFQSSEAKN